MSSQGSTREYYHRRRKRLLKDIVERNTGERPERVRCENCGVTKEGAEGKQLHVHHVNEDAANTRDMSGWDYLYLHEEDFEDGRELRVFCVVCHHLAHVEAGGTNADRLARRFPFLERYEDKDAGFYFKKRGGEM